MFREGSTIPFSVIQERQGMTLCSFPWYIQEIGDNYPIWWSLTAMPLYSKFLKDLLTKKGKYIHSDNIVVEGNYSVVIQRLLPPKYKDPWSVTIPCSLGARNYANKNEIVAGRSIYYKALWRCRRCFGQGATIYLPCNLRDHGHWRGCWNHTDFGSSLHVNC